MKSFAAQGFLLDFDDVAELRGVRRAGRPEVVYLRRFAVAQVRLDRTAVRWTDCRAVLDDDEVEQTWTADGLVRVTVRHSFVGGWRTRLALANLSPAAWTASVSLQVELGEGCRSWAYAAATSSTYALVPLTPGPPILLARSTGAPLSLPTPEHLQIDPGRLGPGDRRVVAWEWSPEHRLAAVVERLPADVPFRPIAEVGQEIWLPHNPDAAIVAPLEVGVVEESGVALSVDEPGRHRVEIRSASGSTTLDLAWVLPPGQFLASAAEQLLAEPPGRTGVVSLPGLAAASVVQEAVRDASFPAATAAHDALDQFTAELLEAPSDPANGAQEVAYLIGEHDRLGDADLLDEAARRLWAVDVLAPGPGVATLRLGLAAVVGDRAPPGPIVHRPSTAVGSDASLAQAATVLEWRLATDPRQRPGDPELEHLLHRVGVELAAGLPGRAPAELSPAVLGHCLVALTLVPEFLSSRWAADFGPSLAEFVALRTLELVDRLDGAPVGDGHAWLTLLSSNAP